jgi:serine/threonine-protein kinase RsbW
MRTLLQQLAVFNLLESTSFLQTYRACFDCLSNVGSLIQMAAKSAGLDERSTYQVETAVDEACSNIIEHAYGGEDRGDIQIECFCLPGELKIIIKDHGKSFNPELVEAPTLGSSLEDRADHGLGLFFMQRWMDSIHFEFSENKGNTLTMVKKLEHPS